MEKDDVGKNPPLRIENVAVVIPDWAKIAEPEAVSAVLRKMRNQNATRGNIRSGVSWR
jgi:hypothetical protein